MRCPTAQPATLARLTPSVSPLPPCPFRLASYPARPKSVVILSEHPYSALFAKIAKVVAKAFFERGAAAIESGQSLSPSLFYTRGTRGGHCMAPQLPRDGSHPAGQHPGMREKQCTPSFSLCRRCCLLPPQITRNRQRSTPPTRVRSSACSLSRHPGLAGPTAR